ncbi:hypothetical protein [Mogibacterium diversum]
MGRIVNPMLMRMGMNDIKKNVESYGSSYRKAKSTLARYSNEAISAKGEAVDAMINQVLCYETVMDMFIVVAENMAKDCDEMSIRVGDEYLNEDSILEMLKAQKEIRQRCSERIEDYRHKQTQFATLTPFAEHCRMQVNLNYAAKERADVAIIALNNKIKKIDEIESNTNNLFLESKSALSELNKCISELEKSGKGGFTYDNMPAWAVAMNSDLLDRYTKSMLSKGRLNEDFVKKFSNLTIAEMTPVEKAVYNKYTDFLLFDAKPEDMNKVVKHYYKRTIDGVLERKKSADELVAALNLKMNIHCMTSPKDVGSRILERCTILSVALTRADAYKIGDITLEDGHYHYKYTKYRYSDSNNATPITSHEEYTTDEVSSTPTLGADNLSKHKVEYLKKLLRKDLKEELIKMTINVGYDFAMPELRISEKLLKGGIETYLECSETAGKKGEFGIDSGGISTVSNSFKLRTSMAIPKTKEGELIYNMYPTNETADRVNFYNEVFKHYGKDPIKLDEALNYPEDANDKLKNLNDELGKKPYKYGKNNYKSVGTINDTFPQK